MSNKLIKSFCNTLALTLLLATGSASATLIFTDETSFNAQLSSSITDDYTNPAYVFLQNNATMSAVLGETDYMSTGFNNLNIVQLGDYYCAGCNGSFQLGFTTTSVGNSNGVFGVGLDIAFNSVNLPYDAFITFGDNSTSSFDLGSGAGFFGITSASLIKSIHFGIGDGSGTTQAGSFGIASLTIGSEANQVPEPGSIALLSLGIFALMACRRRFI